MSDFDDLRGRLVEFSPTDIHHPDAAAVHRMICHTFVLKGTCEEIVGCDVAGGPYAVVRIEPGEEPVIIAVKHLHDADKER